MLRSGRSGSPSTVRGCLRAPSCQCSVGRGERNARTVNGNGTEPATTSQLGSATRRGGGAGRGRPHLALPFAGTCARPSRAPPGPTSVRAAAPRSGHLTVTVLSTDRTGLTSRHSASSRRAVPSRRSTARRCRPLSGPARRGLGARPPHRRPQRRIPTRARSLTERAQTILRKINRVQLSIISTRRPIATSPQRVL